MSQKKESNSYQDVITIRIDRELNNNLNKMKERLGLSKADLIRNYLEMSKFIIKQKGSIKSLNNRNFIVVKRSFLRKLIENADEKEQIDAEDYEAAFENPDTKRRFMSLRMTWLFRKSSNLRLKNGGSFSIPLNAAWWKEIGMALCEFWEGLGQAKQSWPSTGQNG